MQRHSGLKAIFLLLFLPLISCNGKGGSKEAGELDAAKQDTESISDEIASVSRLSTAEYRIRKIVVYDDRLTLSGRILSHDFSEDIPFGDRKVAIPVEVTLRAYVDLSGFSSKNISRSGNRITVTLPDPGIEIASSRIDRRGIRYAVSPLRSSFSDEETEALTRQGIDSIQRDIPSLGIVENARLSAAALLVPLIEKMGYKAKDITVNFRPEVTDRTILRWSEIDRKLRERL